MFKIEATHTYSNLETIKLKQLLQNIFLVIILLLNLYTNVYKTFEVSIRLSASCAFLYDDGILLMG